DAEAVRVVTLREDDLALLLLVVEARPEGKAAAAVVRRDELVEGGVHGDGLAHGGLVAGAGGEWQQGGEAEGGEGVAVGHGLRSSRGGGRAIALKVALRAWNGEPRCATPPIDARRRTGTIVA